MQLLAVGSKYDVSTLMFAPDGGALVACCTSHAPVLWELPATGSPIPLTDKAFFSCSSFTFSPDENVVSWITTYTRMEYDRRTGATRTAALVSAPEQFSAQTVCGPDARLILRTNEKGRAFHLRGLTANGDGWADAWHIGPVHDSGWYLAGSRSSERFFTWEKEPRSEGRSERLVVRSSLTGEVIADTPAPLNDTHGFTAKPDGSALIVFKGSSLCYWQPGEKVQKVRTGTLTHYQSLAFHPDGRHLLAGNNDTTARLIDTTTWQVVRQYTWSIGRLTAVAVSPDGQLAAAGGAKGRVIVWDLDI